MKLITINTHSLIEDNYNEKLNIFVDAILKEKPDIIAMQEVNQTSSAPMSEMGLKSDNHLLSVYNKLLNHGVKYHCRWLEIKKSYEKYDEGIALLSLNPISSTNAFTFSNTTDFYNWKMRKALGIQVGSNWFYSIHTGWWDDNEEPFKLHWQRINNHLENRKNVYLMGDFNAPANIKNESYNLILSSGWNDTYKLAKIKDNGYTVPGKIDGWHSKTLSSSGARIDYIFTNASHPIYYSKVIFDGINYGKISDHYGIITEY